MPFPIEINSLLRSDEAFDLEPQATCSFFHQGSRLLVDDLPIWLTRRDWTARAEIRVVSQSRGGGGVSGQFRVLHVVAGEEQRVLTAAFRRMYSFSGEFDPYLYLLESAAAYRSAESRGFLVREDLRREGFLHASPADQLTRVANKHYRQVADLVCAVVAKRRVLAQILYEPAGGGVYPHIYGPLNLDAVVAVLPIAHSADGDYRIDIPALLRQSNLTLPPE